MGDVGIFVDAGAWASDDREYAAGARALDALVDDHT